MRKIAAVLLGLLLATPAWAQFQGPAAPYINNGVSPTSPLLPSGPSLYNFGAKCDGTTDDANAFAAAVTWMSAATNRMVWVPAATCATSATVTLGNGRERSTTTSAGLSGGETTIPVTSCTGISNGDKAVLILDSGTAQRLSITSNCAAGSMTVSPAVSGPAASGNVIYTGANSTYNGGGFVGYGSGAVSSEFGAPRDVSTIKYIGSGAPTTTLSGTASTGDLTVAVASNASITLDTPIGITLDNGRVWWTKPTQTPASTTINIANEIPSTATSGNTVTIASNPVAKIAGPILNPVFSGIKLDANNLAAIGLDVLHSYGGKFQGARGVSAINYTGIGHFVHTTAAYLGAVVGNADNDYELYALAPQNTKTIGMWLRGGSETTVCVCRNRFHGGTLTMGGNDVTAAGLRTEYVDNNTFIKTYTSVNGASTSGAGLYRQPPVNKAGLGSNVYIGPSLIGNVTDGTATGGTLRNDGFFGYATGDGETTPSGKEYGILDTGAKFPLNKSSVSAGNATGTASTAAVVMMGYGGTAVFTPKTSGVVQITMDGDVRNSTATDGSLVSLRYGTGTAPSNGDAATGTVCPPATSFLATSATASARVTFSKTCIASGLTVGTAYWIDMGLEAFTGGTATPGNVVFTMSEQ